MIQGHISTVTVGVPWLASRADLDVWRDSFVSIGVPWLASRTHSDVWHEILCLRHDSSDEVVPLWHDSFRCVTWLIRICETTRLDVGRDSCGCMTWLIGMCDMTHWDVWHDSFTCVTWLIRMCDMTHSHVWHDSFTCVTWLIHMCDMTRDTHRDTGAQQAERAASCQHFIESIKDPIKRNFKKKDYHKIFWRWWSGMIWLFESGGGYFFGQRCWSLSTSRTQKISFSKTARHFL